MRDVVVTGIGLAAGHIINAEALFDHITEGRSLIRDQTFQVDSGFPNPASAVMGDAAWHAVNQSLADKEEVTGDAVRLAWYTAGQAWERSGLPDRLDGQRAGVFVARNKLGMEAGRLAALARHYDAETGRLNLDRYIAEGGHDPKRYYNRVQDEAALSLARRFGLYDIAMTHSDACAAGGIALGTAYRHIHHGDLDVALAGGVETLGSYISMIVFSIIGAMAQVCPLKGADISRPFDKDRCGFVMGEGSAFLVLESRRHAEERGACILAHLSGFAGMAEACRMTASLEDGSEYARCIEAALADAGLSAMDIDHINAHGTSTVANDGCEAAALRKVFGNRAGSIPLTANKSAMGHSLANSGVAEAVLSIITLQRQVVLPTLNFGEADESSSGLDIVTNPRPAFVRTVLSNSFGFGGENCALILKAA
jgi:3-oxoacyl-[acyl-carrier-protein] synthase II